MVNIWEIYKSEFYLVLAEEGWQVRWVEMAYTFSLFPHIWNGKDRYLKSSTQYSNTANPAQLLLLLLIHFAVVTKLSSRQSTADNSFEHCNFDQSSSGQHEPNNELDRPRPAQCSSPSIAVWSSPAHLDTLRCQDQPWCSDVSGGPDAIF